VISVISLLKNRENKITLVKSKRRQILGVVTLQIRFLPPPQHFNVWQEVAQNNMESSPVRFGPNQLVQPLLWLDFRSKELN